MSKDVKYFNFPIVLLDGFLDVGADKKILDSIVYYSLYAHAERLVDGTESKRFKAAMNFFNITLGNESASLRNGKELFLSLDDGLPKVGLNLSIFWDFYKNEKTEYDKVCFLAFLAIKSIVQNKPFIKTQNAYWLSRMAGKAKSEGIDSLPDLLKKYSNEYQTKKLKKELRNNWGLVTYSHRIRGFYVSFKLNIEQLVYEAEKRKKAVKDKKHNEAEAEARRKALQRLKGHG
jgi:hypothetical protein